MTNIIVKHGEINDFGIELLRTVTPASTALTTLKQAIEDYKPVKNYIDDAYIWLTSVLALQAANMGNFGVGSVLADDKGNIASAGHNEVFKPYFRSDLHAEMVVMNQFENSNKDMDNLEAYTLYTSLESCPMCLMRLITSGVGTVLHAAYDSGGGMVSKMNSLPLAWKALSERQTFRQAQCSETMIGIANDIFIYSADKLYHKLKNRQVF